MNKKEKTDVLNYVNKMVDMYEGNNDPVYPTQASPEMFGKAAERIERERQRSGAPSSWGGYKKAANTPFEKPVLTLLTIYL